MVENINPNNFRKEGGASKKSFSFNFANISNPIALEIQDPSELKTFFKKYPVIPFASNGKETAHGLLPWLNSMKTLSSTLGACHNSIKTFTVGSKLEIVRLQDNDFSLIDDDKKLSKKEQKKFLEIIKNIKLEDLSFSKLMENLYDQYKSNGNYLIELVLTETGGVKASAMYSHKTENWLFLATDHNQPRMVLISPIMTDQYLRDNPPKVIAEYPNYTKSSDGTMRTVIHVKNGDFKWYGRPDWIGSWLYVYREYQDATYLIKQAANNFTGQHFIEVEEDDVENDGGAGDVEDAIDNGFDSVAHRIEQNFTNKGKDPQSVMMTSRPYGAKSAFIYSFPANTNEKFYEAADKISRRKILENNQWSERLLGNAVADGWTNDVFIAEIKSKEIGLLQYLRHKLGEGPNIAIQEILKWTNNEKYSHIGIRGKDLVDKLKTVVDDLDVIRIHNDKKSDTGNKKGNGNDIEK